jgi:magnesium chelatase subunit D
MEVEERDVALAARLVLLPRATVVLAEPEQSSEQEQPGEDRGEPAASTDPTREEDAPSGSPVDPALEDSVREASAALIPAGLLDELKAAQVGRALASSSGRAGVSTCSSLRGRPSGVRRGEPRGGARLNLIETLRAAAPWQALRRREACADTRSRIRVRREDFHVTRFRQRSETTTIFIVDASGSSALHRLAEAKGAVELLLADCYVRRDSVALIAFRGRGAELLLPPTRSLVRAKRSLAGLPGGGGTPLAAGLDAALTLATSIARRGATPLAVLLTDGRANIGRDGAPGREQALADALQSATQWRAAGVAALVLDTSPQPQESARMLASRMGAAYLPLPHADATRLSRVVRAVADRGPAQR